ncbi:MFS transporter [Mycetocola manganoxydans]|uniref:MFS transporter n=1 Tax=Mycetocola manganoxydans TaxID=699879 RepID=A0A3L6ZR49_9MICO|nr:MFS transporter [Mycetocola manganoxydans]RLP70337.1 MFS transporter [Mycetocola manganoxydans]GHD49188.1 MFS transporter [Mycetocola manganoxydans]
MSDERLFRDRDFRMLLLGQTTSQLGAQVSGVAVPLLAVLTLDASPFELGLVTASSTLAFAVIGLPAGAWVDQWRRRPILVASDIARAVLLATIPLTALLGILTITQLVIVSLLSGVARVFFDVGYQSYIPSVLGRNRVLAGNSSLEMVRASGQVVGPGIGGALVAALGAASVILVQSVTFAVSAIALLAIRSTEAVVPRPEVRPRLWPQIREGLGFVARTRVLRATALASATGNFSFAMASAVNMIFLARTLGLSPVVIGMVIAVGSVTAMAGAALTPTLSRRVGSARIIWLSLALTGPLALAVPFAQPGWLVLLVVVGMAAGEFGQIVYAITNVSLRQRFCPERMLGRVTATMRFLIMGLFPLGALTGGILGELIGPRATLVVAGTLVIISPIPVWLTLRGSRDVDALPAWT